MRQAIEIPRDAPSAIDDISSAMPWNISASVRGSSALRRSAIRPTIQSGVMGSVSGVSAAGRPGSRFVSASPLQGHGRHSTAVAQSVLGIEGYSDLGAELLPEFDEMELYRGPEEEDRVRRERQAITTPARTRTPIAHSDIPMDVAVHQKEHALPPQIRKSLDRDTYNFLTYVYDALPSRDNIAAAAAAAADDDRELVKEQEEGHRAETGLEGGIEGTETQQRATIAFESLLRPAENTRAVAAQGLLHTLTLASQGLLRVWQEEAFGQIRLGVVGSSL